MMVAAAPPLASASIPASAVAGRGGLVQFTVDDVLSMIRQGMVGEDASAELLNGFIVHTDRSSQGQDPFMHSPSHRKAVRLLTALVGGIDGPNRHVQIQSPIVCGGTQMPEPDFAVIRGTDDDFTFTLPRAADVLCVVEVSDSSLERDRNEKGPVYAAAGIPQYVILNLRDKTAEIYIADEQSRGTFMSPVILSGDQVIKLQLGKDETYPVTVADLVR